MRRNEIELPHYRLEVIDNNALSAFPPVFLFHGNSSSADGFADLMLQPSISAYRFISISFPGHGGSAPAADLDDYSAWGLSKTIVAVIAKYRFNRYFVVGQSLGGHAALQAVPALSGALGLALISAPPISSETLSEAFLPDPCGGALFKEELSDIEAHALASCFIARERNPDAWEQLRLDILSTDPRFRSSLGRSLFSGKLADEREIMRNCKTPIVIMGGDEDRFVNLAYMRAVEGPSLWKGRAVLFPGAGHCPHAENPQGVGLVLADFLSGCRTSR